MTHVPTRLHHRPGFTLIEMMMAVLLTMLVFGMTIPFFRMQTNAVDVGAGRLDALQNARFAQAAIDRELRIAGGITGQPIIVQADNFSVSFNVNLVTRLNGNTDADATYYNPNADSLSTEGWLVTRAKALPLVTKTYPVANYTDANGSPGYFRWMTGIPVMNSYAQAAIFPKCVAYKVGRALRRA